MLKLNIIHIKTNYSVAKLTQVIELSAKTQHFVSLTSTPDEISLVAPTSYVEQYSDYVTDEEQNWQVLKIDQTLDFNLVGILAKISTALAEKKISIFALSTFNTDYILVKIKDIEQSIQTLRDLGCRVV
ncbi:MAG: ACT domain-containing protein [Gammaproteobacteria bacterium]|nr:ACT domain-containing protein [Gammaproteobacteria bacterium]